MQPISLFFFLILTLPAITQTREELIACLETVLETPEMQPAFQHDLPGGPAVVIIQPEHPNVVRHSFERLLRGLTPDDFHLDQSVYFLSASQLQDLAIPQLSATSIGIGYQEGGNELAIYLSTVLRHVDEGQMLVGRFKFHRRAGIWELVARQVDRRNM